MLGVDLHQAGAISRNRVNAMKSLSVNRDRFCNLYQPVQNSPEQ
ncbi:hypothetical protein ECBCE032MS12_5326 [Escherichia coli BCE032_MS-12]|nr:hypothetical protein ECBCE032MS12_5326 [Escherichia coli BCE032_MS-12]